MKPNTPVRHLFLSLVVAASTAALPALAQINVNISIAPPAQQYETVPVMAPGYVWAPGYWAWHDNRHIWVRGRSMAQRTGYQWAPDRWEQRGNTYYQQPGHWARDPNYRPVQAQKDIKPKHGNNGNGHGNHKNNPGHGKDKPGKGDKGDKGHPGGKHER